MYMPSVLPGLVFVDPQMALDSINQIVQYSYHVGGGAIKGLAASQHRLQPSRIFLFCPWSRKASLNLTEEQRTSAGAKSVWD